jgi:succinate dehydrogenase/fumarate reductase flavoprotein subunit
MEHQAFDHDVLVIGAGGAGLRAAIAAAAGGRSAWSASRSWAKPTP